MRRVLLPPTPVIATPATATGGSNVAASASVTSLLPSTTYYYRTVINDQTLYSLFASNVAFTTGGTCSPPSIQCGVLACLNRC